MACKWTNRTKNYISVSSVHSRIGGRSYGAIIYGGISNVNKCMGGEHCWSESATIHKSASVNRSTIESNGDQYEWARCYREE